MIYNYINSKFILGIIIVSIIIASAAIIEQNNMSSSNNELNIGNEPLNITLYGDEYSKVSRPIEYYELSNGTVIQVIDRNPFPFTIKISDDLKSPSFDKLGVYKITTYNTTDNILTLANTLNLNISHINYISDTKTYIYSNESLQLEYKPSTGSIRIIYNEPIIDYQSIIEDKLLKLYPETIQFKQEIKPIKQVNGKPTEYAIIYTGYIDNLPTPIKILCILGEDNNSVKEIQGIIIKELTIVSTHNVIPPSELPRLLSERVSKQITAKDWYLSRLGFTTLTITNIQLTYDITPNDLLVPVYKLHGEWTLKYDNLDYNGELNGTIIAVYG